MNAGARVIELLMTTLHNAHDFLDRLRASENTDIAARIRHAIEIDEARLRARYARRGQTIYELQQRLTEVRRDACLLAKVIERANVASVLNEEEQRAFQKWKSIGRRSVNSSKSTEATSDHRPL